MPKIPEDVMTLVPAAYADKKVQSLDNRRIDEIYPGSRLEKIRDFEGRTLEPGATPGSLAISGQPARMTIRFRFGAPHGVTLDDHRFQIATGREGEASAEFDHEERSELRWE